MKTFLSLLLLAVAVRCRALEDRCPDDADLSPCSCRTHLDGACVVSCSLASQRDLEKIARIPDLCGGHAHFALVHSEVSGIPAGLWKTLLSSETVDVSIAHSAIEGLVPDGGQDIPEARTPGSAVIKIDHTEVGRWDWKQLRNFRSDEELTLVIDDTPLAAISPDFSQIAGGQVHKVEIDSAGLAQLPDGIFADFEDLSSLSLQNNGITSISRSLMPRPANKLEFLHLK